MVDQCGENLLSGHSGDAEAVGSVSLPDVEGPVGGDRQIDGPPDPLGALRQVACRLVAWPVYRWDVHALGGRLSEAGEALGWFGVSRRSGRRLGAE